MRGSNPTKCRDLKSISSSASLNPSYSSCFTFSGLTEGLAGTEKQQGRRTYGDGGWGNGELSGAENSREGEQEETEVRRDGELSGTESYHERRIAGREKMGLRKKNIPKTALHNDGEIRFLNRTKTDLGRFQFNSFRLVLMLIISIQIKEVYLRLNVWR